MSICLLEGFRFLCCSEACDLHGDTRTCRKVLSCCGSKKLQQGKHMLLAKVYRLSLMISFLPDAVGSCASNTSAIRQRVIAYDNHLPGHYHITSLSDTTVAPCRRGNIGLPAKSLFLEKRSICSPRYLSVIAALACPRHVCTRLSAPS